jgi:hypothetical protein
MPSAIKEVDLLRTHETKNGFGKYRSMNDAVIAATTGAPTIFRSPFGFYFLRVSGAGSATIRSRGSVGPALMDSRVHLRLWAHCVITVVANVSGLIEVTPSLARGYKAIDPGQGASFFGATISTELTTTGRFFIRQPFPLVIAGPDENPLQGHAVNPVLWGQTVISCPDAGDVVNLLDMYWEVEAKETVVNDG